MKKAVQFILALVVVATLTGCSTPYMINRRRDAADIVTIGFGAGVGAKARVGPLQTGVLFENDLIALRGGEPVRSCFGEFDEGAFDVEFLFTGKEKFAPQELEPPYPQRGKTFKAYGGITWIPFVHLVDEDADTRPCYSYYTQIELVGALLGSVRVGVNPGELLDFVLGWTTIDIFNDDIHVEGDYTYTIANGHATITYFNAAYSGTLSITNTLGGHPVTRIGDRAFCGCTNLTQVVIGTRVTSIGDSAFCGCVNLANVTIPNGVASIGSKVFRGCSKLTNVTIPASVTSIGSDSFACCSRLSSIMVDAGNPYYVSDADGVVFNKEKTELIRYPSGKAGEYVIPASIKQIGRGAFEGCVGVTSVTIPDGVTAIEPCTFSDCSSLAGIRVPKSVTRIKYAAFDNCSSLTNIAFPGQLSEIGSMAFLACTNLTSITIPGGVTKIEDFTFLGCSILSNVTIRAGVTSLGDSAFAACGSLAEIMIPASVTIIRAFAFGDCHKLTCVHFEGNAPHGASDTSIFCDSSSNVTVYYRPGTRGWGKEFGGRPTAVWKQ